MAAQGIERLQAKCDGTFFIVVLDVRRFVGCMCFHAWGDGTNLCGLCRLEDLRCVTPMRASGIITFCLFQEQTGTGQLHLRFVPIWNSSFASGLLESCILLGLAFSRSNSNKYLHHGTGSNGDQ